MVKKKSRPRCETSIQPSFIPIIVVLINSISFWYSLLISVLRKVSILNRFDVYSPDSLLDEAMFEVF